MGKEAFYFIVCIILLLQIEQIESPVIETVELIVCSFLILTLGISHGGVDNILHQAKTKIDNKKFIAIYIFVALLNAFFWVLSPNLAFLMFILISSYHFGQSQFVEYNFKENISSKLIYFLWGALVIVGLVFFKSEEILNSKWYQTFSLPLLGQMIEYSLYAFVLLAVGTCSLLAYKYKVNEITIQQIFIEVYQFALICIAFKLFSVLLGFTLYFIILHSLRVLNHEYAFLRKKVKIKNLLSFIKMLLPFTLLSIFGLSLIVWIITFFDFEISLPLLALILTSSVTLPHSYVMDAFYKSKVDIAQ